MTAPGSFTVGYVLTAADMNEFGAWTTTTTPTVGGLTKGNATTWYRKHYTMQNIGFMDVNLTFGSTSAVTGNVSIDTPAGWVPKVSSGAAYVQAAGTIYPCFYHVNAGETAIIVRAINAAGTYAQLTNFSATIPGTWTTGDFIRFLAVIELA